MNPNRFIVSLLYLSVVAFADADTISQWTYEVNTPADTTAAAGPSSTADSGNGTSSGLHASAATAWTTPVGNGSANSYNANTWAVNDYFQFTLSTVGYSNLSLTFSQTSSNTGPRDFALQYTTNGSTYTQFATYSVLANASPNPVWNGTTFSSLYQFTFNLSGITALNNNPNVGFRLVDVSTISANGGAVAAAGTSRVDDFTVSGTLVPEPATAALLGLGLLVGAQRIFRRRFTRA